jgi:hypothetical protein
MRSMKSLGLLALRHLPNPSQKHHYRHQKAWRGQLNWHRWCGKQLLQDLKDRITRIAPYILVSLLQSLGDRLCNLGEVKNEPSIIASQHKETSHLGHRCWRLPIQVLSYLARVHRNSLTWYHVAQEWYSLDLELRIANLGVKLVLS